MAGDYTQRKKEAKEKCPQNNFKKETQKMKIYGFYKPTREASMLNALRVRSSIM
jgi:hypothetical protein